MDRAESAVFTNMCMVYDNEGNILVQNRLDPEWPGITFPGGHVERGESFAASVIREVKEETGLDIERPILCGLKHFERKNGGRYIVFFYKTCHFSGELQSSSEGQVFWIPRQELDQYQLAHGFDIMLKVFENDDLTECYYEKQGDEWKLLLR